VDRSWFAGITLYLQVFEELRQTAVYGAEVRVLILQAIAALGCWRERRVRHSEPSDRQPAGIEVTGAGTCPHSNSEKR